VPTQLDLPFDISHEMVDKVNAALVTLSQAVKTEAFLSMVQELSTKDRVLWEACLFRGDHLTSALVRVYQHEILHARLISALVAADKK